MPAKSKTLIYLIGSLGDSIVAIPAVRAVKRHFSDSEIVLLQNFSSGDLIQAAEIIPSDLIDDYLTYKSSGTRKLSKVLEYFRLWRAVRSRKFNVVVYLVISERSPKAVQRDKVFFRSCGISRLIGFHPFSPEELYPVDAQGHPAITEHEAVRKLNRLEADGVRSIPEDDFRVPLVNLPESQMDEVDTWLASRIAMPGRRLVTISPGCKIKANSWPLENFIEIGHRLIEEYDCEIIVIGGPAEHLDGERMISEWGRGINAAGAFPILGSAALLSRAGFHIGLDTGTTHLAAAVGTRCFSIFGDRNNPGHWYPLGDGHTTVTHPVQCGGCRNEVCPLTDHPCMFEISVDAVWELLLEFSKNLPGSVTESTKVACV